MSQANEFESVRELIPTHEIQDLAMCPHAYLKRAIWWTRLAAALDLLAEDVRTANLGSLGQQLAHDLPELADQALALEGMGSDAIEAIESTRAQVTLAAGVSQEAMWVRDSVKWVFKRIQLINYLVEDFRLVPISRARALA